MSGSLSVERLIRDTANPTLFSISWIVNLSTTFVVHRDFLVGQTTLLKKGILIYEFVGHHFPPEVGDFKA